MSFLESIEQRYTTKKYDSAKTLDNNLIEELKKILSLSPSSINSQPWNFTFVTDKETRTKLAEASFFNAPKVNDSQALVVFRRINNLADFEKQIEENLPEGAVGYYKNFIKPLPEDKIKTWLEKQVYISLGVFLSACAEMKIDSTPMEGIDVVKYDAILADEKYTTLFAVSIGYRDDEDSNQPKITPKSRIKLSESIKTI